MNVFTPLNPITEAKDAIFLAGPSPRCGVQYSEPCEWRNEFIQILQNQGFSGDIIDPVNRNFDRTDLGKQIKWETDGLKIASSIVFWIPRSKEHPAFTTNIELGEWIYNPTTFIGWPEGAIKNDYIEHRCNMAGKKIYRSLEELTAAVREYFEAPMKWFATSDLHFGQERTLTLSKRPFRDVEDMDISLISNWNKKIRSRDGVICLGDFGDPKYLPLLNFKAMLFVNGNYETEEKDSRFKKPENDSRIKFLPAGSSIIKNGNVYYLTHEPIIEDNDPNKFWLFGHIHRLQLVKRNGVNVGVDGYRFTPLSFDEIEFLRGGVLNHFDENVFTDKVGK